MRFLTKMISSIISFALVVAGTFLIWLSYVEYMPDPVENAQRQSAITQNYDGRNLRIVSWNIGYGALGKESDFFMDGGTQTRPSEKNIVTKNMNGIITSLNNINADFYLLQEIDKSSMRSYFIDEIGQLENSFPNMNSAYALNYSCPFVPFPWPPIGKVESGLLTLQNLPMSDANRISLPVPFQWPLRIANLKRCLLVSYIPISHSSKQLVVINLHLEAYDSGEGKIKQFKMLKDFMISEYQKGNYVVVGGDFNQAFPGTLNTYPMINSNFWTPGTLEYEDLPNGWKYCFDPKSPTCRLLNQPYEPSDSNTQFYIIDGFIVSPNIKPLSVVTYNGNFEYSDHNPVVLDIQLLFQADNYNPSQNFLFPPNTLPDSNFDREQNIGQVEPTSPPVAIP